MNLQGIILRWDDVSTGDHVDVDTEYNYYYDITITEKLTDVATQSGLESGRGYVGMNQFGEEIVFYAEDARIPSGRYC
ncbi:hypothetical protein CL622_02010 [archaeon]|nr:hypothetical protein [archaeon]|tara:strand:- start:183 stop:416 length:234 start_codon:yes stop_codon:yes gene_type:complete